ncbi:MAG: hypothetical protein ACR5KV_00605 [Wolbachia sp.]
MIKMNLMKVDVIEGDVEISKKDSKYINIDNDGKIYIKEALDKFYPDLNLKIIDEIKAKIIMWNSLA